MISVDATILLYFKPYFPLSQHYVISSQRSAMLRPILLSAGAVTAGLIVVHLIGLRLRPNPILYFILLLILSVGAYTVLQRVIPQSKITPIWRNFKPGPHVHFEGPDLDDLIDTEFQYPLIKPSQCTEKANNSPTIIDPTSDAPVIAPVTVPEFSPATHQYVCTRPQLFSWNREDAELVQSAASFHPT